MVLEGRQELGEDVVLNIRTMNGTATCEWVPILPSQSQGFGN